jgi:hypothetical protein
MGRYTRIVCDPSEPIHPSFRVYGSLTHVAISPVKDLIKVRSMFNDLCPIIIICVLTQISKENDPNPSLKDLMTLIRLVQLFFVSFYETITDLDIPIFKSHDLHVFYVSMHGNARKYKEQVKTYNDSRKQEGKKNKKPKSVEMNNFQNPQVRNNLFFWGGKGRLTNFFFVLINSDIQFSTFGMDYLVVFVHLFVLTLFFPFLFI